MNIQDDFTQGFLEKCANLQINPHVLYKYAARGDMLKKLIARHVYKGLKAPGKDWTDNVMSRNVTEGLNAKKLLSATPHIDKETAKVRKAIADVKLTQHTPGIYQQKNMPGNVGGSETSDSLAQLIRKMLKEDQTSRVGAGLTAPAVSKVAQQKEPFLSEVENKTQKKRLETPGKGIRLKDVIDATQKVNREGFNNRIGIKYNHGYPSSSTK
jgi:hypothetical protein